MGQRKPVPSMGTVHLWPAWKTWWSPGCEETPMIGFPVWVYVCFCFILSSSLIDTARHPLCYETITGIEIGPWQLYQHFLWGSLWMGCSLRGCLTLAITVLPLAKLLPQTSLPFKTQYRVHLLLLYSKVNIEAHISLTPGMFLLQTYWVPHPAWFIDLFNKWEQQQWHLLCAKHCGGLWGCNTEPDRGIPCPKWTHQQRTRVSPVLDELC